MHTSLVVGRSGRFQYFAIAINTMINKAVASPGYFSSALRLGLKPRLLSEVLPDPTA